MGYSRQLIANVLNANKPSYTSLAIVLILSLCLCLAACGPSSPTALPLTQTFDKSPTGFLFKYPADWDYTIPVQGILISGFPESLQNGAVGPLFTVQRGLPISVHDDLSGALNAFLNGGPLREPENWRVTLPEHATTLEGRQALAVELEGHEPDGVSLFSRIIVTASDNTFVYLFIVTVPLDDRDRYLPTFDAMLDSVRILE